MKLLYISLLQSYSIIRLLTLYFVEIQEALKKINGLEGLVSLRDLVRLNSNALIKYTYANGLFRRNTSRFQTFTTGTYIVDTLVKAW